MKACFSIYDYRDMYRICGTLALTTPEDHPAWQYLDLTFESDHCTVYAANGVQLARMIIPCETKDIPYGYHIMVRPVKPTSHTKSIELHIDEGAGNYTIIFIDGEDEILDSITNPLCDLPFVGFDKLRERMETSLGVDGCGNYSIAVNPKVLLRTLEGLKAYDKIIFNFADKHEPFRVFPVSDDNQDVECYVYPMRLWT